MSLLKWYSYLKVYQWVYPLCTPHVLLQHSATHTLYPILCALYFASQILRLKLSLHIFCSTLNATIFCASYFALQQFAAQHFAPPRFVPYTLCPILCAIYFAAQTLRPVHTMCPHECCNLFIATVRNHGYKNIFVHLMKALSRNVVMDYFILLN